MDQIFICVHFIDTDSMYSSAPPNKGSSSKPPCPFRHSNREEPRSALRCAGFPRTRSVKRGTLNTVKWKAGVKTGMISVGCDVFGQQLLEPRQSGPPAFHQFVSSGCVGDESIFKVYHHYPDTPCMQYIAMYALYCMLIMPIGSWKPPQPRHIVRRRSRTDDAWPSLARRTSISKQRITE